MGKLRLKRKIWSWHVPGKLIFVTAAVILTVHDFWVFAVSFIFGIVYFVIREQEKQLSRLELAEDILEILSNAKQRE